MATPTRTPQHSSNELRVDRTSQRLTTETKHAFKTTEFVGMVVVILGILISAAVIKGGDTGNGTDEFIARQAWLYVSIVAGAYFVGRGLAKSGSRDPYFAGGTNEQRDNNGGNGSSAR